MFFSFVISALTAYTYLTIFDLFRCVWSCDLAVRNECNYLWFLNLTTLHQRTVTQEKKRLNVWNWSNFCLHFHPPLLLPFDLQPDHMSHQLLGDHEETHPALLLWVSSLKPNKKINRLIFSADACLTLFLLSECRSVESSETVQQNVWV